MEQKKEITQQDMVHYQESVINDGLTELESLLPSLGHGEAKRLLMAAMKYPAHVTDVSHEKDEYVKAYSACKRISDALVGLGVEAMIDGMARQQMEQQQTETKEESNG